MAKGRFEEQLAALDALKSGPPAEAEQALRKALTNRNGYYVSKAAAAVEQLSLKQLIPDLLAAYTRFFGEDDPQCWAKNALSKALSELGHDEPEPFLRGLAHVQMEAAFGGRVDTAGNLRANCAMALVACRLSSMDVLRHLTPVLLDPDKSARIGTTRAVASLGLLEGSLLLRLRALQGDDEPEVLGEIFSSIISIERQDGIHFVGKFLDVEGEAAAEAALSLGQSRTLEAFECLKQRLEGVYRGNLRKTLLTAIALTRLPEATQFLLALIQRGDRGATDARQSLLDYGALSEEQRARLETR